MRASLTIQSVLSFILLSTACQQSIEDKSNNSPLEFRLIEQKKGRQAQVGDFMQLNLRYSTQSGELVYSSENLGEDFILALSQPQYSGDPNEAFALLHEGDSAVFTTSADSVFGRTFNQPLPPQFKPGDKIKFQVRLQRLFTPAEFTAENQRRISARREEEEQRIGRYLEDNMITAGPVRPGVYFIEFAKGFGPSVQPGDSISLKYTGRFLDGTVFDGSHANEKTGLLRYRAGAGVRLKAWEDAILTMRKGSVVRLILTSDNAYGRAGAGPVPGGTPILFDIELEEIIPNNSFNTSAK
jgi:FKBP-type peptidyl-prolyl cis-trans isomerase